MHFVGNEKRDIRGKRETRSLARKEKRDISHEKWDISRNVWHFTRNLVVDIEKVRQFQLYVIKKHFFFLDGRVASFDTQEHYFTSSR